MRKLDRRDGIIGIVSLIALGIVVAAAVAMWSEPNLLETRSEGGGQNASQNSSGNSYHIYPDEGIGSGGYILERECRRPYRYTAAGPLYTYCDPEYYANWKWHQDAHRGLTPDTPEAPTVTTEPDVSPSAIGRVKMNPQQRKDVSSCKIACGVNNSAEAIEICHRTCEM